MSYKPVACEMARYNEWQNGALLDACDGLGVEALEADRGLFFSSIFATLDHILHVDRTLIGFFADETRSAFDPKVRLSADYDAYKTARRAEDTRIRTLCEEAGDTWFEDEIAFHSEALGRTRHIPRWFYAAQMFNHQTHHRSQVTSALHTMGIDYGNTDMPHNPLSIY